MKISRNPLLKVWALGMGQGCANLKVWAWGMGQGCANLKVWARLRQPKGMGMGQPNLKGSIACLKQNLTKEVSKNAGI